MHSPASDTCCCRDGHAACSGYTCKLQGRASMTNEQIAPALRPKILDTTWPPRQDQYLACLAARRAEQILGWIWIGLADLTAHTFHASPSDLWSNAPCTLLLQTELLICRTRWVVCSSFSSVSMWNCGSSQLHWMLDGKERGRIIERQDSGDRRRNRIGGETMREQMKINGELEMGLSSKAGWRTVTLNSM